ncbi:hypothetical protein BSZ35_13330 [Salinibacter sp. 10B]|nr:hypothetical protein BSZ35_13330 [Salinibacter sp. 10B]
MNWDAFPVVLNNKAADAPLPPAEEATVVFFYSPYQCYSSRDAMHGWHRAASQVEEVHAVNVLQERSRLSARRYLNTFTTPYRTRLDTIGWFQTTFDLSTTPAVILMSEDEKKEVIYPTATSLSNEQRRRHVQQIVRPTDS